MKSVGKAMRCNLIVTAYAVEVNPETGEEEMFFSS